MTDATDKLTSKQLAELIVDCGMVKPEDFEKFVEIAEEEIMVRKVAGDY